MAGKRVCRLPLGAFPCDGHHTVSAGNVKRGRTSHKGPKVRPERESVVMIIVLPLGISSVLLYRLHG
ncbi:hypothetical protein M438DRAFT_346412 [Aureobasidium pullulans EXF-150]|uniref:Uncharacterized protein n=1 Tax=Aureobasidium pullulans EXF-150 TaxID=1043002 RepID=A0A074XD47_AURPU|nr:uncharacterized protein M438DRAFT_346412 [Aureobasidium pullulans EXF-150]KEQ83460.1 hypothetical protein M438DRAFT_346412 [Aureobasidium pullulans EXF-150]